MNKKVLCALLTACNDEVVAVNKPPTIVNVRGLLRFAKEMVSIDTGDIVRTVVSFPIGTIHEIIVRSYEVTIWLDDHSSNNWPEEKPQKEHGHDQYS